MGGDLMVNTLITNNIIVGAKLSRGHAPPVSGAWEQKSEVHLARAAYCGIAGSRPTRCCQGQRSA